MVAASYHATSFLTDSLKPHFLNLNDQNPSTMAKVFCQWFPTDLYVFQPPPPDLVLKLFTPRHLQLEITASAFFTHGYFQRKYMFTFLKLLQLIKCCHNWFLKKLKQSLKKHVFTIIYTFLFFMCDDLSFINTTQKTLKPSKKMKGWEKNSFPGILGEGYQQKHEMQVASKKVYWKSNRVFQTLATYHNWKRYFFRT